MRSTNSLYGGFYDIKNAKYPFQVKFKDSSVKVISSQIYDDTVLHKKYLLFVDKSYPKSDSAHRFIKIYPEQTVYILRDKARGDGNDHEFVIGMPNDSCWMFKVKPGHINIYSYLSEDYFFVPVTITGIQLNDGPILQFNEENLTKLIGDDSIALKAISKKKYLDAVKIYNKNKDDNIIQSKPKSN